MIPPAPKSQPNAIDLTCTDETGVLLAVGGVWRTRGGLQVAVHKLERPLGGVLGISLEIIPSGRQSRACLTAHGCPASLAQWGAAGWHWAEDRSVGALHSPEPTKLLLTAGSNDTACH